MESGGRFRYNIRMMSMIRVKDIGLLRAGMHVVKSRPNLNRPGGKNLS